ncbi:MAG: hypothetical protein CVV44_03305 [Spirochaetae bacterium HGW-Spirochaetae-1]|jgi:PAS domain S-box-containing protein|nr:MAG: hypothetical protein CVV44_03305 [Spirochaetae bacterium HGW-Spirochaetae-1]
MNSDKHLTTIFDTLPHGIGLIKNRRIIWHNRKLEELLGYSTETVIGTDVLPIYESKEEYNRIEREFYKSIHQTGKGQIRTRVKKKDGSFFHACFLGSAVNPSNIEDGIVVIVTDVTEETKLNDELKSTIEKLEASKNEHQAQSMALLMAQDELWQTQAELQKIRKNLERAQVRALLGTWECDLVTGIFEGSEEAMRLFSIKKNSGPMDFESILTHVAGEDRERQRISFNRLLHGENPDYNEIYTVINPEDGRRIIHSVAELVHNEYGDTIKISGTVQDITRIMQAEQTITLQNQELQELNIQLNTTIKELEATNEEFEAQNEELIAANQELERTEHRYRSVVEDQTELIGRSRPNGAITFVNEAYCRYFNVECQTVTGTFFSPRVHEDDTDRVAKIIHSLSPENRVSDFESRTILENGETRWLQWTVRAIFNKAGVLIEYQYVGRDITDLKKSQLNLQYKSEFERLITAISAGFITTTAENFEPELTKALQDVGLFTGVDRAYIYLFNEDFSKALCTAEWTAGKTASDPAMLRELPVEHQTWWYKKLNSGEICNIPSLEVIPDSTAEFYLRLHEAGIKSLVDIPLIYGENMIGYMGLCTLHEEKIFFAGAIPLLQNVANIIAGVLTRHKMEKALQLSEERFRSMADNIRDGLSIIENGRLVYSNSRVSEITGYSHEELRNFNIGDIYAPEEKERIRHIYIESIKSGSPPRELEFWIIRKDGERRCILNRYSGKKGSDWNSDQYIITTDVTEKKDSEAEMKRLATAVEQAAEDIILTDTEGNIQYVNPAFEKTTGYSRDEALGKNPRILKSGRHEEGFYKNLWDTISTGLTWTGKIINKRKDGEFITQDANISPIRNQLGHIMGYVSVKRDISEQVQMEAQLLQAQKMEAIGTLVGGLAHDFNNILGGILGSIDMLNMLLRKETLSSGDKIRKYIDTARDASFRATDMIKQLLTLSRKHDIQFAPVDLNYSVKHVMKICQNSFPKNVELHTEYGPSPMRAFADPTQIEQVILNLCVNASHAMTIMRDDNEKQGGKLTVSLRKLQADHHFCKMHPDATEGISYMMVSVTDTGVGIYAAVKDRIFDPFFTTKDKDMGTGLGLAMVYNIVKQHGGFIDVLSEPKVGSTFNIYLPEMTDRMGKGISTATSHEMIPGSGTILVIDDEEVMRTVAEGILMEAGYRVILAESGKTGLSLFKRHKKEIRAVILDMSMPVMSGLEVFQSLKNIVPEVKVLLASGYKQDERVQKVIDLGVTAFLQKPYSGRTLTEKLHEILENGA